MNDSEVPMATVKTIGSSGQIALGKEYAGRHVLIDEVERGVWVVKLGDFIPESERWLHEPRVKADVEEATAWAEEHAPRETDLKKLSKRISR
jgi:hypothetical protein